MKDNKTYFRPDCFESSVDMEETICLSFDDNDYTENWQYEDEETI